MVRILKGLFGRARAKPLRMFMVAVPVIAIVVWYSPVRGDGPWTYSTETGRIRLTVWVDRLQNPWSLAFLPDGDALVTERPGRLRWIRQGRLQTAPVSGVPAVFASGQGGLLDVVVHPRFSENRWVYLTYSKPGTQGATTALARGRFVDGRLDDVRDLLVADAWSRGGAHFGSRLAFGRDGLLYMTVGERNDRQRAQNFADHTGSVLRLRDDGSVPPDNPFVGKSGTRPEIWSKGHRCAQGLAFHPDSGLLFEHEHGPRGGDELNVVRAGRNYGWPVITYGREYTGMKITDETARQGMEQPLTYWVPSIAPSGLAFYTGDRFPRWKGNAFVGALAGAHLRRVVLDGTRVTHQEVLLSNFGQRIRDVRQGPDGLLYVVTDEGRGAVLRLEPAG